jgi:hypothetical protein
LNHGTIWLSKIINIIRGHSHSQEGFVGVQEQRQASWPWWLRGTVTDSIKTSAAKDGCDVPTKIKMLPSRQNKVVYPTLEDHIAKEPSLHQQQGWVITTYDSSWKRR